MGKGKGSPEYYACRVKPGRILFEVDGVSEERSQKKHYIKHQLSCLLKLKLSRGLLRWKNKKLKN